MEAGPSFREDKMAQYSKYGKFNIGDEQAQYRQYLGEKNDYQGARWYHFRRSISLKFTEMKLRPFS